MELNNENFSQNLSFVQSSINQCDFVSLDTEFTGLALPSKLACQYFDTIDERYRKLSKVATQHTLTQIFAWIIVYQFRFSVSLIKPSLTRPVNYRSTSAVNFLKQHHFDFNKFIYHGIPYLRKSDCELLQQWLTSSNGCLSDFGENYEKLDQNLEEIADVISEWSKMDNSQSCVEIDFMTNPDQLIRSIAAYRLSRMFPGLNIQFDRSLTKLKLEKKRSMNEEQESSFIQDLVQELQGSAIIFDILLRAKKPIVGYNCFVDLLYCYEKFYSNLPDRYADFKSNLHSLLPHIFDTKHIVSNMAQYLSGLGCKPNSLAHLYNFLELGGAKFVKSFQPYICFNEKTDKYQAESNSSLHEAGFDAYLVGVVFLRLSHLLARKTTPSIGCKLLDFSDNFAAVQPFMNKINLVRSSISYADLAGDEVKAERPTLLLATLNNRLSVACPVMNQVRKNDRYLHLLSRKLVSFGSQLDVNILPNGDHFLISVAARRDAEAILQKLRHDSMFCVKKYNFLKHSAIGRFILWSGSLLTISASLLLVNDKILKRGTLTDKFTASR